MQMPWFGKNQPEASALSSEDPPHGADCFEAIEPLFVLCEMCGLEVGSHKALSLTRSSHTIVLDHVAEK